MSLTKQGHINSFPFLLVSVSHLSTYSTTFSISQPFTRLTLPKFFPFLPPIHQVAFNLNYLYNALCRQPPSLTTLPSQIHLHNRYEALDLHGQIKNNVDEGPSRLEANHLTLCMTITSIKRKRLLS